MESGGLGRDENNTSGLKISHTTTFIDFCIKTYNPTKYVHFRKQLAFNRKLLTKTGSLSHFCQCTGWTNPTHIVLCLHNRSKVRSVLRPMLRPYGCGWGAVGVYANEIQSSCILPFSMLMLFLYYCKPTLS